MEIKRLVGGGLNSNGYIIYEKNSNDCYVIDPGYDARRYVKELEAMNLDVKGILLTHHHYDHIGAVEGIVERFECPVYIHREDGNKYRRKIDVLLEDGDQLTLGKDKIEVIHTPGHTKGCVCYYSEKDKVVFTGDTLFDLDIGRTDLADSSHQDMVNTIRNIISKWKDDFMIYPGHGDSVTMKYVRKNNRDYRAIMGK